MVHPDRKWRGMECDGEPAAFVNIGDAAKSGRRGVRMRDNQREPRNPVQWTTGCNAGS
jgi:hypothetical protein